MQILKAFEDMLSELNDAEVDGAIWSRPGLAHKQRSLVSISILAALGKQTELSAHVKGALNNGLTEEELKYRISDMSAGKVLTQYYYLLGKCSCK